LHRFHLDVQQPSAGLCAPRRNGFLELACLRDHMPQRPTAFATPPKLGFFRSGTRPAVADSDDRHGAAFTTHPVVLRRDGKRRAFRCGQFRPCRPE
jgi:hypothetical protein